MRFIIINYMAKLLHGKPSQSEKWLFTGNLSWQLACLWTPIADQQGYRLQNSFNQFKLQEKIYNCVKDCGNRKTSFYLKVQPYTVFIINNGIRNFQIKTALPGLQVKDSYCFLIHKKQLGVNTLTPKIMAGIYKLLNYTTLYKYKFTSY